MRCVRCIETNEIFPSASAASARFGLYSSAVAEYLRGTNPLHKLGYHFEYVECSYDPAQAANPDQEFRPIPGYENRYSISRSGTVKNDRTGKLISVQTTKVGQHLVLLHQNSLPTTHTVETLIKAAWLGINCSTKRGAKHRSINVECIETEEKFSSIKEACAHAKCDYAKMRSAIKEGAPIKGNHYRKLEPKIKE